ncbi:ABC transporter ATP-binding protein [Schumannella luteola]|uniref:Spermidine/putrescine import ATP-binding protein PotA n=1 Tax=Schumannella luteola TaxID=472059 RepID=A0A852YFT7_9MICO|nr:ABC transporter ATP-binding protein [Schumannella luteola]NYG97928.1 spermidine/putrescine transport system ATP-binding protein [Schumannella luteola]TPX03064.1 ABC transporter ATP-binding protein [Schumannella luteola]
MTETPAPVAVRLRGITKTFGSNTVVRPLDLDIRDGEFFSILGPSGCGKTTLMRMITGFESPTDGSVELAGRDVSKVPTRDRDLNMLFQSYALFPHLSVYENVAFELRVRRTAKAELDTRVREALQLVRLADFGDRKPNELSGGQRQRVALARAVVGRPAVVLLDEPLGALDQKLRKEMQFELKRMQREVGITFIYVTHDQEEALTMSDRIAVMSEGRVLQVASPIDIYDAPASRFVAGFIGSCNLIPARLEAGRAIPSGAGAGAGAIPADTADAAARGLRDGAEVVVAVRPERVTLHADPAAAPAGAVRGIISARVFLGDEWTVHVDAQGLTLTVQVPSGEAGAELAALADGAPVAVSWTTAAGRILPAADQPPADQPPADQPPADQSAAGQPSADPTSTEAAA